MQLPLYQLDAFSKRPFAGNPAAVVPLSSWLPDDIMQAIAAENNLAETAFYSIKNAKYHLRWFTPTTEVDLCGHATLATAAVILQTRREIADDHVSFETRSGTLHVLRDGDRYTLDLPAASIDPLAEPAGLYAALDATPVELYRSIYTLAVFETEEQIRAISPNMFALAQAEPKAIVVTAPGSDCDFVSRLFGPAVGIPEDPVTGSSHCALVPFWAKRLGKRSLYARQISARGGELWCELKEPGDRGDRVSISGYVAPYLEGTITI